MSPANDNTVILITGSNRGIGKGLVERYLQRPNHTVLAGVRFLDRAQSIKDLPKGKNSYLIPIQIDNLDFESPQRAFGTLQETDGIDHIDVIIANAGMKWLPNHQSSEVDYEKMVMHFRNNSIGPLALFHAATPWLSKSDKMGRHPKFVAVSSTDGSIELAKDGSLEYSASKSALNMITRQIHLHHEWLIAFPIHPGWVQTAMGTDLWAHDAGISVKESAEGIMKVVDSATREATSGHFMKYDGGEAPW
ncbi:aflatoxin biosynthesis ketoreductase nor-1 [Ascosphaera apis ARSEF 7405]|uniref:Aflatoxin biosynthesis ketoreductase nor-1 n=1 Tax=Ascosphaera apis ARSEF 7405 TaxID=392613 RepID=A0A167Z944_9EURO|nr:aflatoxin biosynthesis ketoreductase nor-1 [Ascosphaera apis ARSEF 7405]